MADINSQAYMRTYSGKQFFPSRVEELEVDIKDIAHALANVNRYNGHLELPFNVAQHSLIVEDITRKHVGSKNKEMLLMALLHDAVEAYMPDMPKPIKDTLPDFKKLEAKLHKHIFNHFGLPDTHPHEIHVIDQMIRKNEMFYMTNWPEGGLLEDLPYAYIIKPIGAKETEQRFLKRYYELCC